MGDDHTCKQEEKIGRIAEQIHNLQKLDDQVVADLNGVKKTQSESSTNDLLLESTLKSMRNTIAALHKTIGNNASKKDYEAVEKRLAVLEAAHNEMLIRIRMFKWLCALLSAGFCGLITILTVIVNLQSIIDWFVKQLH